MGGNREEPRWLAATLLLVGRRIAREDIHTKIRDGIPEAVDAFVEIPYKQWAGPRGEWGESMGKYGGRVYPLDDSKAGRSPVDRGKQGIKRSVAVDADGIPLGTITAPANRHDSPLLDETLDTLEVLGSLPEQMSVHLDRGYDSETTRQKLKIRGMASMISEKGKPAPLQATKRWVVERTNSWHNAHKKLLWCTERRGAVIDFWIAFSEVIIIVRRLIRRAWTHYRWETRPTRRP